MAPTDRSPEAGNPEAADHTTPHGHHNTLAAALAYAARGWAVFPCWWTEGERCACGDPKCDRNAGKHPLGKLVPHGLSQASTDPEVIRRWWSRFRRANAAIRTGAESGIVVIDADLHKPGASEALSGLRLPPTRIHRTPSGGCHYLYRHPGHRVANSAGKLGIGIDVRGDGGYVVAPPSTIRSAPYQHVAESGKDLAPLPDHLIPRLVGRERPRPAPHGNGEDRIPKGQRNATLASLAGSMRRRGMLGTDIFPAMSTVGHIPGYDPRRYGQRRIDPHDLPPPEQYYRSRLGKLVPGNNGWFYACCPFHDDAHPSLAVNLVHGGFGCHACEAKGGNIAAFEATLTGITYGEALRRLVQRV